MPVTTVQKTMLAKHLKRNTMGSRYLLLMRELLAEHGGDITDMFNDLRPFLAEIFREDMLKEGALLQVMADYKMMHPDDEALDQILDHVIDQLIDKIIVDVREGLEAIPVAEAVDNGFMSSFSLYKLKAAYPKAFKAASAALVAAAGALALNYS